MNQSQLKVCWVPSSVDHSLMGTNWKTSSGGSEFEVIRQLNLSELGCMTTRGLLNYIFKTAWTMCHHDSFKQIQICLAPSLFVVYYGPIRFYLLWVDSSLGEDWIWFAKKIQNLGQGLQDIVLRAWTESTLSCCVGQLVYSICTRAYDVLVIC